MTEQPRNIILLSADALRADHLSCYGYERDTTPNLDSLSSEGISFTNAYSASSHTREAIPALLTGRYPDDAVDAGYRLKAETIASRLSENGYQTGGFHSNPYASRAFGFGKGFDRFFDDLYLGSKKFIALAQRALDLLLDRHYARAEKINRLSLSWLDSLDSDEPFFLWNHYMDTHGPYEPPEEFDTYQNSNPSRFDSPKDLYKRSVSNPESISEDEQRHLRNSYDGEIQYLDHQIGEFLSELDSRDLLDDTVVIVTADHGDAFGEHEYYGHPRVLDDELLHVPLLIRKPDGDPAKIDTNASTIDILPIIESLLGRSTPELPGWDLESLAATTARDSTRTVFSSARGEDETSHIWRFSARRGAATAFADFDSQNESLDITGDSSVSDDLRAFVAERESSVNSGDSGEETADSAVEDRLSALGYK